MEHPILILTGLLAGALGLFSFSHPWAKRGGLLLVMALGCGTGLLSGSWWGGLLGLLPLICLPWVMITLQARNMRLPLTRALSGRFPPAYDAFPHLGDLTEALEGEGFDRTDDSGWDGGQERHFLRIFYHEQSRTQAAICLIEHGEAGLYYMTLTTRTVDGLLIITSDCPSTGHLKDAPEVIFRRTAGDGTVPGLVLNHESYLQSVEIEDADREAMDVETLAERLSGERLKQVQHNVTSGIIEDSGSGLFRYSWRGCFYLWGQFLKDLVRAA